MHLVIPQDNPSIVRFVGFDDPYGVVANSLEYTDKSAQFEYLRFKNSNFFKAKLDPEVYQERLDKLKGAIKKSLLEKDEVGYYTLSGLTSYLSSKLRCKVVNEVVYPEPTKLSWANVPTYKPYEYQTTAAEKLIDARHGGVEIGTGMGKSFIIVNLLRNFGKKSLVMTPSTNLSEQLYKDLVSYLGVKHVGRFYEGKKESKKLIVVGNAQSLTRVDPDSPHYKDLASSEVFISDESHSCPANTLMKVCTGLAAKAPYRWFFSATQTRGDGKTLTLDGVTGPIVFEKTVAEGVEEGYLAKPHFKMVKIRSESPFDSADAMAQTRAHLFYNPKVTEKVGKLVNLAANAGMPVVVLIEEIEQFVNLMPYLRHEVGFAHGTLTADHKKTLPEKYHKSDVSALVKDFNEGKIKVLVGTSCISTGTDIKPVRFLVYWQGGKSEIQVKQAVGRGTRKPEGKTSFTFVDFDVENIGTLHNHAEARRRHYEELYNNIQEIE